LEDQIVARASHDPEDQALVEQLGSAKQQLMQLLMTVPKDLKPETLKSRAEARGRLSRQVEELQGALAQNVSGFGHARRALTVTVPEVQKSIPSGAALVEFIYYDRYLGHQQWDKSCGAVVLTASGEPKWVCLGSTAKIDLNVLACQQAVRDKEPSDETKLSLALHGLYEQIWKPLVGLFPPDTKIVIISPDGTLNFVSFATLLTSDDRFLAEKYSIRYVASGRDLLRNPGNPMLRSAASRTLTSGSLRLLVKRLTYTSTSSVTSAKAEMLTSRTRLSGFFRPLQMDASAGLPMSARHRIAAKARSLSSRSLFNVPTAGAASVPKTSKPAMPSC
jgi:CHAT domain-containing protein